jgi:hypothetical protein
MTYTTKTFRRIALALALLPLAACDSLLDVEAPGRIADENLDTNDAVAGIVAGMKYDLSQAVDGMGEDVGIFTNDLWHGGSYAKGNIPRGDWPAEDVTTEWESPQQARWVSEQGIERIRGILTEQQFAASPLVAEGYLYGGFANRLLGEHFCRSTIDGGPEISNTEHFSRGLEDFDLALQHAQAAGNQALINAAYAGRAQMKLNMEDYAGAAADAAQVPVDFVFNAEIDTELRNEVVYETHTRYEYTVWSTIFEPYPDDPRAPWEIIYNADGSIANGANGATPHYRQNKYMENSSDIPLAKGTEMLLIQAENALRGGDIAGAYGFINQARTFYGMATLPVAADEATAWDELQHERRATLWLELRAMWDLRRFFDEGRNDFLADRDKCVKIAETELDSNPNLSGG